jgi:hypothetical protein
LFTLVFGLSLTVSLGGPFNLACYPGGGKETKMKLLIGAAVVLAFSIAPAGAERRYDRKLEQAAMQIVAEKIGDIRGGFSYAQKPRLTVVQDAPSPGAGSSPRQDVSPSIVAPPSRPAS